MAVLLFILIATLIAGAFPLLKDFPAIGGSLLGCGAGERTAFKILTPLLLLSAVVMSCLLDMPAHRAVESMAEGFDARMLLPISIATVASAAVCSQVSRFPACVLAFTGAVIGTADAVGLNTGWESTSAHIISWIIAPLLCGALAALAYRCIVAVTEKRGVHLLLLESRLSAACAIAGILLVAAFGLNNSAVFSLLPASVLGHCWQAAVLAALGLALCLVLLTPQIAFNTWSVTDNDFDINSESCLAVLVSLTLVFAIWASPLPGLAGLTATPLPAGTLLVAALTGISLTRGRALVEGEDIVRCIFATILAPLLGALAGFSIARITGGDLTNSLIVIGIAAAVAALVAWLRIRARQNLQRQAARAREQQLYNSQRSLSALEVKAEMTEKDLMGKLENKRKELVDFAVGVSDQKKFMEDIYDSLRAARALPDGAEKNAAIDRLLASLRERMYFTREMNDFYARSEVLHKDFNIKLLERFPNLTEGERRLANLLRQGFSSKYIASLMNITPKSVEISRYRLRAKLGLKRDDNLTQFIKTI